MRNRVINHIALSGVCALALAGCSEGPGADADGDGTITAEEMANEMADGPTVAMRPGKWESKMEYAELNLPGVPEGMKDMIKENMGKPITTTQCLTEEDVGKPDASFFNGQQEAGCSYDEFDRSGNRMVMKMSCDVPGGGVSKTNLEGEFSPEAYTMNIDGSFSGGPTGEVTMKGTITGRRIGDC